MKKLLVTFSAAAIALMFGSAQAAKHEMPAASGKGQQQKSQNMEKKEVKKQEKTTAKEQKAEKKTEKKGDDKAKK